MRAFSILLLLVAGASPFAAQYFTNVTSSAGVNVPDIGQAALFADIFPPFDQVHHDLVVVSDWGSDVYLYSNDGDGTFTREYSSGVSSSAYGYYAGDYNNDGYLDLFCASSNMKLYENNGDGTFSNVTGAAGLSGGAIKTLLLDFDNDGWLDIFFVYTPCKLYQNNGDGTFSDVTAAMGLSGASCGWSGVAFDYDNDLYLDLYLIDDPVSHLWHNDSGTGFTDVTSAMGCGNTGSDPEGVDVGDFNNDGWFDIYIANISEQPYYYDDNRLYRNDSGVGFTDITASAGVANIGDGRATWFLDYNNDGLTDLFCTNHVNDNAMYRNNGDDTFTDVAGSLGIRNPWDSFGVSWCDYDYDGDLDVYMSGHFDNRLLRNDDCPGNYIVLQMEGTDSNRSAIGTKVKVTAGGFDRYDMVIGGSGKNGQDSLPLEFGLGSEAVVDTVQIRWPSGLVEEYEDLDANHHYYVTEGDGIEVDADDGGDTENPVPTAFTLFPASPNPAVGTVTFGFALPKTSGVQLDMFDIKGRKVGTIIDETLPAGEHTVSASLALSPGIYLYRLRAGEYSAAKKLVVK